MKFSDIIKSVGIILVFALLYFSAIITVGIKKLKEDWPKHRCSPAMMPFASYLGHDTMANFTHCVGNIQKDMMGFFLQPIQYVLGMVAGMSAWILERVQFIRKFIDKLRGFIKVILGDVYGMMVNVLIQFQKLIIKTKDTIMKLIGIVVTLVYLIMSAVKTGQSLNAGPIGETLRTLCFSKNTEIKLKNGDSVKIADINLGDILENDAEVYGLLKLKGDNENPYYRLWSDKLKKYILVTGSHKICPNENRKDDLDNYIEIKDHPHAKKTNVFDKTLYCLITSNHQIPIGEYTFWDWED